VRSRIRHRISKSLRARTRLLRPSDLLAEDMKLNVRRQAAPVRHVERDTLIVVENGTTQFQLDLAISGFHGIGSLDAPNPVFEGNQELRQEVASGLIGEAVAVVELGRRMGDEHFRAGSSPVH